MIALLFLAVILLTYFNGANDNFKGVATLWGSGTLDYKTALALTTVATFAGSICSYLFAQKLVANFSGNGVVPPHILHSVNFLLAIASGTSLTVWLATRLGFPISTTHGLVGGIIGSGLVAAGGDVNFSSVWHTFLLPLVISPVIAVCLSGPIYWLFHASVRALGITEESCACIGKKWVPVAASSNSDEKSLAVPHLESVIASGETCKSLYQGRFFGLNFQPFLNGLHCLSAVMVSFSRGLNDTPKLLSLLLITSLFHIPVYTGILAFVMAVGGLLNAKQVARTMSKKISKLDHAQGFTANLVTGILVIFASRFGFPVSTTHVAVGSIYGIGLVNKTSDNKEIIKIAMSWFLTLPCAAFSSALLYFVLHAIIR